MSSYADALKKGLEGPSREEKQVVEKQRLPTAPGTLSSGHTCYLASVLEDPLQRMRQTVRKPNIITGPGIPNTGNTCYLASIFQVLMADSHLVEEIRSRLKGCIDSVNENKAPFARAFLELADSREYTKFLDISQARYAIAQAHPGYGFQRMQQQDAHEFFIVCIDTLREELSSVSTTNATGRILNYSIENEKRFKCCSCGKFSDPQRVVETGLSLEITRGAETGLEELIQRSYECQEIERRCAYCKAEISSACTQIAFIPRTLVFHLNRFKYYYSSGIPRFEKDSTAVNLPKTFHLDSFLGASATDWKNKKVTNAEYRLRAVVRHRSNTMRRGHYMSDILNSDGSWTCYNDSKVAKLSAVVCKNAHKSQSYLVWYEAAEDEVQ